jgi:hypothetical protein
MLPLTTSGLLCNSRSRTVTLCCSLRLTPPLLEGGTTPLSLFLLHSSSNLQIVSKHIPLIGQSEMKSRRGWPPRACFSTRTLVAPAQAARLECLLMAVKFL